MFLQLAHTKLDVFKVSKEFVLASYKIIKDFPSDERFAITAQIRRAAVSVLLNISEGCSRHSIAERKRFYEIARGSLIEVDTAFDLATELGYTTSEKLQDTGKLIVRVFQLLSKLIRG